MKTIFYTFTLRVILLVGIVVGIMKGQEARQKWVSKKKMKYESKKANQNNSVTDRSQVMLDEIEMSTYHS
jgi:hypothetical protein